jgi:hypothetical protein
MKIVINTCYGGFSLSKEAFAQYCKETGTNPEAVGDWEMPRDNPVLIRIVEEMGEAADGSYAALKVVEIPDGVNWCIEDYDGQEWVAERHRTWS